ncbi:MAG: dipicolinate synthase, partial [Oscillospiraceae bacterium]|nr:dipicolinate synthase [Oscillospiraceae bacterium]
MQQEIFAVVGGDLRQAWLAGRLAERGNSVYTALLDRDVELSPRVHKTEGAARAVEQAGVVVLPLPITADGIYLNAPFGKEKLTLEELFPLLKGKLVLGGRTAGRAKELAQEQGVELVDYFEREELAVKNAVPTAEGAIQIAMEELPTTIFGARVLVIGFGRIGKLLAHRLKGMGARVTVSARNYRDLAWIEAYGYCSEHTDQLQGWL